MDPKLLHELGKVVVNFGTIEMVLRSFIARMISEDKKIGAIVTAEMSFQKLIEAFASLTKHLHPRNHELENLVIDLDKIEKDRNTILHSGYVRGKNGATVRIKASSKRKQGLKVDEEELRLNTLKSFSVHAESVFQKLVITYNSIYPGGFHYS